jgi:hypothetical protein
VRCRCGRPAIITHREVVTTAAHDPDFAGIGSSFHLGDIGGFLPIPQFQAERLGGNTHLFRLTPEITVPAGDEYKIVSLWNYLTLREQLPVDEGGDDDYTSVLEREVVSPGWHPTDANAVFALRILTGEPQILGQTNTAKWPAQSVSTDPFGGAAARLIGIGALSAFPAFGGKPPGELVGSLGTQRFMAFPFTQYGAQQLSIVVPGPATIEYYAWIRQTNPATRPFRPPPPPPEEADPEPTATERYGWLKGQRPEDDFLQTHTNVQYGHVGGAITYEREFRKTCLPCQGCRDCCSCKDKASVPWWRRLGRGA